MNKEHEHTGSVHRPIRVGRVDSLTLYEVTDHELDQLEQGSPSSLQLNFACALLPLGASFWVSLKTSPVTGNTYTIFVVITVVSLIFGLFLLISWWKNRNSVSAVIKKIKERVPAEERVSTQGLSLPVQSETEGDTTSQPSQRIAAQAVPSRSMKQL